MKYFFLFLFLLLTHNNFFAQSSVDSLAFFKKDSGIIQDPRLNELIYKSVLINETKKETIKGYRVQIHFGTEKTKALDAKNKFMGLYQNKTASYLDYQQPYFKIRVGNFRTKLEAYKFLQEISGAFPGSFIVTDNIELSKLE